MNEIELHELARKIGEALSVGGRTYPNRLHPMMTHRARELIYDVLKGELLEGEQITSFYGGFFSQWFRCDFVVDGVGYNCTEQYMMAEKARLFGDEAAEKAIMAASHPRDQKAIGRKVKNFDRQKWDAVARDIVYKGNYAKFVQNRALEYGLRDTAGTILVEASPTDKIWGVGLSRDNDAVYDRSKWQGTNWLGEVLMKVRDDLIAGVKTDSHEWSDQPSDG